jgi:hypothetical protein
MGEVYLESRTQFLSIYDVDGYRLRNQSWETSGVATQRLRAT